MERKSRWFWVIVEEAPHLFGCGNNVALLLYFLHDDGDSEFSFGSNKRSESSELTGSFSTLSWIEQLRRFADNSAIRHYPADR
jgi:hypothetical protein